MKWIKDSKKGNQIIYIKKMTNDCPLLTNKNNDFVTAKVRGIQMQR